MKKFLKILFTFCFLNIYFVNFGQVKNLAPEKYWVQFTDKNNSSFSVNNPEEFLSAKAIERRNRFSIEIAINDLPVNSNYIDSLENLGLEILGKSKWFNSVIVRSVDTALLDTLQNLSFVDVYPSFSKKKEKNEFKENRNFNFQKKNIPNKKQFKNNVFDYGLSFNQISMLNGHILHNMGFQGQGMEIAIIDGGFYKVDELASFDSLFENNQILGTRDFVENNDEVYDEATHGMMVLSTIGGNYSGKLIGTAPKSKFWLLRSETVNSEYLEEEFYWTVAAEFSDSVGVDILTTSLGYSTFDDPAQNHNYEGLDGESSIITIASNIAVTKGLFLVSSAGNSGNKPWHYITVPADANDVLTVGAVDNFGSYASFSSTGFTSDGRIKPDITAQGVFVVVQSGSGEIGTANGTSFSCPIIAGLVACLWQSNPEVSNLELLEIIKNSSDRYENPDSLYGYGIPDFEKAYNTLNYLEEIKMKSNLINISPNPFKENFYIDISDIEDTKYINIEIFDLLGIRIFNKNLDLKNFQSNKIEIKNLFNIQKGTYILNMKTDKSYFRKKLFKL